MFSIARTEVRKEVSPHSLTGTFDPLTNVITGLDPVTFGLELAQNTSAPLALEHVIELPNYSPTTTETGVESLLYFNQISRDLRLSFIEESGGFRRAEELLVSPLRKKR